MKLSKLFLSVAAFFAIVICFTLVGSVDVNAKRPTHQFSCLESRAGKLEVLAVHSSDWVEDDDVCNNSGARVFFLHDTASKTIGYINWEFNPDSKTSLNITDCDGTDDYDVDVEVSVATTYAVVVRLVGPKTDQLKLKCMEDADDSTVLNDICVLPKEFDLTRGNMNPWTKIVVDNFKNDMEGVTWELICNGGTCARHMKVELWETDGSC